MTIKEFMRILKEERDLYLEERAEKRQREKEAQEPDVFDMMEYAV